MDIVLCESGVECSRKDRIEDGACKRERYVEEGADNTNECGRKATQTGEQGGEADENLEDGGDQCDHVGDKHPLRGRFVCGQAIAKLCTEELVDAGVVQAPDFDRVEPKLICMWRAKSDVVGSISEVSGTIIPQRDMVEVVDVEGILDRSGGFADDGVGQRIFGKTEVSGIDDYGAGICSKEVEVIEGGIGFVGASQSHNDQADERCDGQRHRRENARKSASFAHIGGSARMLAGRSVGRGLQRSLADGSVSRM